MSRIIPSRFSYDPECTIEKTTRTDEPHDGKPATGEDIILRLLSKYGFMNLMHIQRALNMKSHRTINARKSLTKMQQRGKVEKYTIYYPEEQPHNDFYILSEYIRNEQKSVYRYDMEDIPYILEHLSVTQWHISVLEGEKTKEKMFYKTVPFEKYITQVPSLIEFRSRFGKKISICAIPIPKGQHKQDVASLITQIITLNGYFSADRDRYGSFAICLICESETQIEEVSKLLLDISETSELFIIYSLDSLTDEEDLDPLSMIYDVERQEGNTRLNIIKLRG